MDRVSMTPERFGQRSAPVAVIGLGKIGLPLAVYYAQHGRRVIGCDINPAVVETINAGHSHVHEEPGLENEVAAAVMRSALMATSDTAAAVREADVVVVVVPVLVNARHEVDFRAIDAATEAIGAGLAADKLVIYETTLPVGTTSGRLRAMLERSSGLTAGHDFYLAFSPERVQSRHIFHGLAAYPKVVGGLNEASTAAAIAFYRSALGAETISMATTSEAEFVKLIETTYRDVNIALANEYARYADARGLNLAAAIAAANSQPYSHIHTPGVGVGGHCIPVYPHFLMYDEHQGLSLPRLARVINDQMAAYAVERIEAAMGSLAGRSALILGVAYRHNIRETAFTSARRLQSALIDRRATVYVDDPLFSDDELEAMGYAPLHEGRAGEISAIILQADHQPYHSFDFARFPKCEVVFDGRWALRQEEIEALGKRYMSIGDGGGPATPRGSAPSGSLAALSASGGDHGL